MMQMKKTTSFVKLAKKLNNETLRFYGSGHHASHDKEHHPTHKSENVDEDGIPYTDDDGRLFLRPVGYYYFNFLEITSR